MWNKSHILQEKDVHSSPGCYKGQGGGVSFWVCKGLESNTSVHFFSDSRDLPRT